LSKNLGDSFDRRIIVTDSRIALEEFDDKWSAYRMVPYFQSLDLDEAQIIDATDRAGRLNLRQHDIFLATAWWTARSALELGKDQNRFFGRQLPFVYILQDDEPYFYGWGSKWLLAESTYRHTENTIAIINSEELFTTMTSKYKFKYSFCYEYRLNEEIDGFLNGELRERIILIYARPHAIRNAFELICDGLFEWQQRDPIRAREWHIVCLGEQFDIGLAYPLQNIQVEGKVSLRSYASYLNKSSVGISLMVSPHPSYPPLEMAEAGLVTITNNYGNKDLAGIFSNIIALDFIDASKLADAVEAAINAAEPFIGHIGTRGERKSLRKYGEEQVYTAQKVAGLLSGGVLD
jgi:hypothetical protein